MSTSFSGLKDLPIGCLLEGVRDTVVVTDYEDKRTSREREGRGVVANTLKRSNLTSVDKERKYEDGVGNGSLLKRTRKCFLIFGVYSCVC